MSHAVAQGQVNRHEARCRQAAEQILFFQQQDLRAVPGRRQRRGNPCDTAPGHHHIIRSCHRCLQFFPEHVHPTCTSVFFLSAAF